MTAARSDVLVIGAGLAGLAVAERVIRSGRTVTIVEARGRVGGRTHTEVLGGRERFDRGAQWVGASHHRVRRLASELRLKLTPTPDDGKHVLETASGRRSYRGTLPLTDPLGTVRLGTALARLEWLRRRVPADAPHLAPDAARLDATTLRSWQESVVDDPDVVGALDAAVRTIFGAEPDEVSLLAFLHYAASSGGVLPLIATDGGCQQDKIVGGTQALSLGLLERVGPEHLRLEAPIRTIVERPAEIEAVAESGERFVARRVVVAVPLGILSKIRFEPVPSIERAYLEQRVSMGATIKVFAMYERPFWRERGFSGQVVSSVGPLSTVFDNTTGDQACLLGFVVGHAARTFGQLPPSLRRERAIEALTRVFGPEAAEATGVFEVDWGAEPWTGGCPVSNFGPGVLSRFGHRLRAPIGRIHFAGTETARVSMGYMEGALESADRVAEELRAALA